MLSEAAGKMLGRMVMLMLNNERGVRNGTANDQDYQKRRTGEEAKLKMLMLLMFSESGLVWFCFEGRGRELIRGF